MQFFFTAALLVALAGRALAFNQFLVGLSNFSVSDILTVSDSPVKTTCASLCDSVNQNIQACGGDTSCQCTNDTVVALQACEQCMYSNLIQTNKPLPDVQAGSTPILSGYVAACVAAGNAYAPSAEHLVLPANWDGPMGVGLGLPATIVTVFFGAGLAVSAIWILSNM